MSQEIEVVSSGAQGNAQKSRNHRNEGFALSHTSKSKSHKSKMKQNDSMELLAIPFPYMCHKNTNKHANKSPKYVCPIFAIFLISIVIDIHGHPWIIHGCPSIIQRYSWIFHGYVSIFLGSCVNNPQRAGTCSAFVRDTWSFLAFGGGGQGSTKDNSEHAFQWRVQVVLTFCASTRDRSASTLPGLIWKPIEACAPPGFDQFRIGLLLPASCLGHVLIS